jgi:hypothetical protein
VWFRLAADGERQAKARAKDSSESKHFGGEDKEVAAQDKKRKERKTSGRIELAPVGTLHSRGFASSHAWVVAHPPVQACSCFL